MLIEPFTTFIVPTLYSAYMEFKMRVGASDEVFTMFDEDETEQPPMAA
jgi:Cu(I)/Ag(I) efflux system membrane protein CusA/SilA